MGDAINRVASVHYARISNNPVQKQNDDNLSVLKNKTLFLASILLYFTKHDIKNYIY